MKSTSFEYKFVPMIPDTLMDNTLYVSLLYNTAVHKCACGCGEEVVTPISPKDWKLVYDGQSVSLLPSIGNWSYRCRSHYWIKSGQIVWAETWSDEQVQRARHIQRSNDNKHATAEPERRSSSGGLLSLIKKWFI